MCLKKGADMLVLQYLNSEKKYEVEFSKTSEHVVTLLGEFPVKLDGFTLSRKGFDDKWDYSKYVTLYRNIEGGAQFSDDGSEYIEPTKTVVVSVSWNDGNNVREIRPDHVDVKVSINDEEYEIIRLSEENEWKKEYDNIPKNDVFTITASDVADYDKSIYGTTVAYSTEVPEPYEPTVNDLAEAITEIYEMVDQNASDIIVTQEAVAEIYEMIGE